MSKVIEDGGQFLGAGILTLGDDGWVGVPPHYGEPMEPHVSLLHVGLPQARVEAVDLASGPRQGTLQGSIIRTQPVTQAAQGTRGEPLCFPGTSHGNVRTTVLKADTECLSRMVIFVYSLCGVNTSCWCFADMSEWIQVVWTAARMISA